MAINRHRSARPEEDVREDDLAGCHHARGIGRVLRENHESREHREQLVELGAEDRPDLNLASMRVCCAMAKPSMRDMECVKRLGRYFVVQSKVLVLLAVEGEATEPLDGRPQPESS